MVYDMLREIWQEAKSQTGLRSSLPRHPWGKGRGCTVLISKSRQDRKEVHWNTLSSINKTHEHSKLPRSIAKSKKKQYVTVQQINII